MGSHNKNSFQSKADQTVRISKSVFVSNFPEGCTAKDLWKVCNDYGTVVEVFISNKKSKVGKRFAFVRFIKRPKKPNLSPHNNAAAASSYPQGVDQAKVLVLDDSCVAERDLSNHVMGTVKDVSSISNLRTLIMEEGFSVVNLVYLRGLWVMIECDNVKTKANMKKWGEALDIEDNVDSSFGRKCLCIKTKLPLSILESFKVIFKGKVYMVRAKELFTWSPIFLGQKEMEYTSDEDSDVGPQKVPYRSQFYEEGPNDDREGPNDDRVSDVEEVLETNFGDNSSIPINHIDELEKQQSEDPFNIYRLLRKQPGDESHEVSSSLSHPPGFTPDVSVIRNENGQSAKEIPVVVNAKVMNNSQDVYKEASCDNVDPNVVKKERTWSPSNSKVLFVAIYAPQQVSRLKINIQNSQVLGVGIPSSIVMQAASSTGCGVLHKQFRYLGVMVGECGRLTLLKAVLCASSLYNMSIFKVTKGILNSMEAIRNGFAIYLAMGSSE
nr:hypothetical protein [Tanacetum cinerariifolium]